jgi:N6-adenosine-specific RNA methylase IME4
MTDLALYDEACRAIAEAVRVDEAKVILDKAIAMQVYARQAKNNDLEADAAEIRLRAERRIGELIEAQKETEGLNEGTRGSKIKGARVSTKPTLADAGVDKNLAHRARRAARFKPAEFKKVVAQTRKAAHAGARAVKQASKKADRAEAEQSLATRITALPDERYGVIYMDPEWKDEVWSLETGGNKLPLYPTSGLSALKARDIPSIAYKDCVLFMWATNQHLAEAIELGLYWGFTYRSNYVWYKPKGLGMGYWNRSKHELLLIFARGKIPSPAPGEQWDSVVEAVPPSDLHSSKPDIFADMIAEYYPNIPKIELNARGPREGWTVWGNES